MINNIIVISDLHCGCRFGLLPKEGIQIDGGNVVLPSPLQLKMWGYWEEFWGEWVPKVTKKQDYAVILNGDAIDGVHHGSTSQISHNIKDQENICVSIMKPIVSAPKCKAYYHIRGTEVHGGISGDSEERIAESLGAVRDELGAYSRWELWLRFGANKALIHVTHHIGTTSSASYESTAVQKEMVETLNEAGRWGDEPPVVIVRSHRHREFETRFGTKNGYGISLVTPAWQLKTPFTNRIPLGRTSTPHIGGYLIREGDEDMVFTRHKVWRIERSQCEEI